MVQRLLLTSGSVSLDAAVWYEPLVKDNSIYIESTSGLLSP